MNKQKKNQIYNITKIFLCGNILPSILNVLVSFDIMFFVLIINQIDLYFILLQFTSQIFCKK